MNSKKFQILMAFIFLCFGILITIQIKSIQKELLINDRQRNIDELNVLLNEEHERVAVLEKLLDSNEAKLSQYEKKYLKGNDVLALKQQLDHARLLGGLTDVVGSGIILTLDDSRVRLSQEIDPKDTIIHDYQLIEVINLLKSRGAQAISINGERIVATSEIQCAGPTVSVNGTRYSVPFVISAIGNADYLEASLKEPGSMVNIMSIYGIQSQLKNEKNVKIPKYKYYYKNSNIISELGGKE